MGLSRSFQRDIQVAQDQLVVRAGPYAAVRHPAYAGNLLMLAGLGVADALLIDRPGDPYRDDAATTARLLPGVW